MWEADMRQRHTAKTAQGKTTKERLADLVTPEARFVLRAMAVTESHGGHPSCSIGDDGQLVFTYPDGAKTCGGVRIN
jgi:hypothetical protein